MNSMPKSHRRSVASLKLPNKVPALLTQAQNIVQAMTGNPSFPSPTPPRQPRTTPSSNQPSAEEHRRPAVAERDPELAVLSVMAHGQGPRAEYAARSRGSRRDVAPVR